MNNTNCEEYVHQIEGNESVTEAILRAVASISNQPPLELPPLQDSIETQSLNQLFVSSANIELLRFSFAGFRVTVEPDRVRVREHEEQD